MYIRVCVQEFSNIRILIALIMTSQAEFLTSYECIKTSFRRAMKEVDTAISHEESEHTLEAITSYQSVLKLIDETFQIPVGLPDEIENIKPEWNDACIMIQKLKTTKSEVQHRLKVLRSENVNAVPDQDTTEATEDTNSDEPLAKKKSLLLENPSTYYDVHNAAGMPKTYKDIINGLREVIATTDKECDVTFDTLFQASAKLYKIESDGSVTTVAGATSISLVLCTVGGKWKYLNGIYFLQCPFPDSILTPAPTTSAASTPQHLIWIYPLIPSLTTSYRTEYGAFIFPDLESNEPGSVFGIIITDEPSKDGNINDATEQLADLQQFFMDLLEAVLAGEITLLTEPRMGRPAQDASQQVSKQIVTVADCIARNLIKGAEKTGEFMVKSTPYLISKMNPAPADAPPVSSAVQTTVEVAKNVTSVAVGVTGWVAGKVGSASMAIGRYLAPHIQTQGANLLEKSFGYNSEEANSKMEGAMTIAAGAFEGVGSVYDGLETSAKILGNSLSNNSVKIIEHKYGPSAANVAAGTFDTIGNTFIVSNNVNYITPKGMAKKMVKITGKAVVNEYKKDLREESHYVPAGILYPDLTALKEKHVK